jgi:uncharacterized repeat protein (TIGR03803 family)
LNMKPGRKRAFVGSCALVVAGLGAAQAQTSPTEVILHSFPAPPKGANPYAGVVRDSEGNLYGTAFEGGRYGAGVVYKLSASGEGTVLYNFMGGADGANPQSGVILDSAGNLYGTTYAGGPANYGVVYKIATGGVETVLHTFAGTPDGATPASGVTMDASGDLYGTTSLGGAAAQGVIYEINVAGQETVLHSFTGAQDGSYPSSGVVLDTADNLYGTTFDGGSGANGVVYMLSASGQQTILYNFTGGTDGANPTGVIRNSAGDLFGSAESGGKGSGIVYKLSPSGVQTVLHSFGGGSDGELPQGNLVRDSAGNLYGITYLGGSASSGTVFKVTTHGQETVLYSFPGGAGGYYPEGSLSRDSAGNLYGTTAEGGVAYGLVYQLSAAGDETVLLSFPGAPDGYSPESGVILDAHGNLFGTTVTGGTIAEGTVYEVSASGGDKVLHTFQGGSDGIYPYGGVVRDAAGNLYGTTYSGGAGNQGVVYQVSKAGEESVLYTFSGLADGGNPYSGVTLGSAGNLYGTTYFGGGSHAGVVYRVAPSGAETVLHSFTTGSDGGYPYSGVTLDAAGNLYGTTLSDGVTDSGAQGAGVVYKLSASGDLSVLYTFTGDADGALPRSSVILDEAGNMYGTTSEGGSSYGVVYKLDTTGKETVLYSFTGGADGANPYSGLVRDSAGTFYGTTERGGLNNNGVVYELDTSGKETVLYTFDSTDGANPIAGLTIDSAGNLYGTTNAGGRSDSGLVFKIKP